MTLRIIEQTPHELVIVKPAGLPSELPFDAAADSVVRRLEREGFAGVRLVHRLDSPACGLMVVARSAEAAAHYAADIAARRWHKWYVARVAMPHPTTSRLLGPQKAYLKTEGRVARVVRSGGKPSFLDVVAAAPVPASRGHADVLVRLLTGRFHQIRAMLAHLGAPLVGDVRYGGPAAPAMYLEHVMLAARPCRRDRWRLWPTPPHDDRPAWDPALVVALAAQADRAATELAVDGATPG